MGGVGRQCVTFPLSNPIKLNDTRHPLGMVGVGGQRPHRVELSGRGLGGWAEHREPSSFLFSSQDHQILTQRGKEKKTGSSRPEPHCAMGGHRPIRGFAIIKIMSL